MKFLWWMIGLALLIGTKLQAQNKNSPLPELEDGSVLELRIMDDPDALFQRIKKHIPEIDPSIAPVTWIRALWVASKNRQLHEVANPDTIARATQEAFKRGMFLEWLEFRIYDIEDRSYEGDSFEPRRVLYEKVLEELRQTGDAPALAMGLANYAEFLLSNNALSQSLPIIDEANRLIKDRPNLSLPVFDMVKYVFALSLRYQGQVAASVTTQLEIEDRYRELHLRSARAANLYDLCLAMTDQGRELVRKNSPTIEKYFTEAIRLGTEIGDIYLVAKNQYGFSSLMSLTDRYAEALVLSRKALDYFEKASDKDWISRAHRRYGIALIEAGHFQQSFGHLDKAEQATSKTNKHSLAEIEDYRFRAWKGLGRPAEALKALESYMKLYRSMAIDREDKAFNQTAVKLGLQYEAERNKTLALQNELQSEQIRLLKKFRLVSLLAASLSAVICGVLIIVWRQASIIRMSRQQMKDVLDHIDEGILILNRQLRIQSGYSPFLDKIFGTGPSALCEVALLDLLFPHAEATEGTMIRETLLACMGESELTWELNHSHLPHEIVLRERVLQLHWQPLFNSHKLIARFLLSIRDITNLRSIERKMEEESQRVQKLEKKLAEVLGGKPGPIRNLLRDLSAEWSRVQAQAALASDRPLALRRLHTWKGAARTLGLKVLASSIHEMETSLQGAPSPAAIESQWNALNLAFQDYQHLVDTILVSHHKEDAEPSDLYTLAPFYAQEMKARLEQAGCPHEGLLVLDQVQTWKPEVLAKVHEMLLHAVTNAVDHGFIRPLQENQTVSAARIHIRASVVANEIEILVLDNGAGIPWARLRAKAEALGFRPGPNQSYADLLFQDGFSTASSTTETSGRGVGLGAVRSLCQELGGRMSLTDAEGGGAALRIQFARAG